MDIYLILSVMVVTFAEYGLHRRLTSRAVFMPELKFAEECPLRKKNP